MSVSAILDADVVTDVCELSAISMAADWIEWVEAAIA